MSRPPARLKVLSVVGAGRSGTTLLASILGEVEGFASAGELRWLWERGVVGQRPCGCGDAPTGCPVWAPVIAATLRGAEPTGPEEIVAAQRELARRRNWPRVLRSIDGGQDAWPPLRQVRTATRCACHALAEVTGSRVVVDTSKRPLDAAILAGIDDLDHYVLHMIRDPRAVVHSWRRPKSFTAAGRTRTMGTRSLPSTVRRWNTNCVMAEGLRHRLPPSRWLAMRYEDLTAEPRTSVDRILAFVEEGGDTPFVSDHELLLHSNHIVAGNPSRFTTGAVTIKTDDAWRQQMPRKDQGMVGIMTMPLLLRYGYAAGQRQGLASGGRRA